MIYFKIKSFNLSNFIKNLDIKWNQPMEYVEDIFKENYLSFITSFNGEEVIDVTKLLKYVDYLKQDQHWVSN